MIISHDIIRAFFLENDNPPDQSAKLAYRFQWILAEDMIKQGRTIIIDSTCSYKETLDRGTALARQYNYDYRYVECKVDDIDVLDGRLRRRVSLRSQAKGVNISPPDARGACNNEDNRELFKRWMDRPCRPTSDAIIVDSTGSPEKCLDYILKQIDSPLSTTW